MRIEFQIDSVSDAQLADRVMSAISVAYTAPGRKVTKTKETLSQPESSADTSTAVETIEKQTEVTDVTASTDPVEQYNRIAAAAGVATVEAAKPADTVAAEVAKVEAPAETVAQTEPVKEPAAAEVVKHPDVVKEPANAIPAITDPSYGDYRDKVYDAIKGRVIEKGALWARSQYAKAGVKKLSDMTVEQLLALQAELDGVAS